MNARDRLPPWHERHRLANGRELLVRPIRPEDAEPLRLGFGLLEPELLRAWLLCGRSELTDDDIQRLTRVNPKTDFALVATDMQPPGEAVIAAHAHARVDASGRHCDFGIVVSRFVAGLGVGRYLLTRVTKWSKSRGLASIGGELPAANEAMLGLADTLGFTRATTSSHASLARIALTHPT